ncbi:DeoR/GlpR family DNA-binding transcription regulator [Streptococcus uberis]|uniref:Lactose phosphotransferase system repressor n=2 Tax=Streptococcus uberis TaxID=1349 RepID=B9DTF9_STRU0|nr:DeoR/GlpR family DNA-binding transcription regulator [Streptococcus uberis]KKF45614.1 DeoR family transcriptional regulator [Streptococcus uberis Ab71]KKF50010.1 DeoR family transcriptional regulator [Streptococcus uberis C5072]KKF51343.1 DeoR family transcriptional regulator [Streptococcus uberis S6261]KKF55542.1 DeoR family transcriptional regulator [Streptococcus uberis B190]KKF61030.1 DeoR family transcriptional regulator [Streptococcus uberis 6736]
MLKEERQKKIIDILNIENKVIASELSSRLKVSEDTIRRDLKELDMQGLVRRVRKGALRIGPPITQFTYREHDNTELKRVLAAKALPLIKEDTVILIDGSSTNLFLVKLIPIDFSATIITNSPPIAISLSNHKNINIIMLGGSLYKNSMINVGIETIRSLEHIRVDTYIIGVYNIDFENGMSVPTQTEAEVKRKMIEISTEVIGLISADKFATVSNYIVAPAKDINYIVTHDLPETTRHEFSKIKTINIID